MKKRIPFFSSFLITGIFTAALSFTVFAAPVTEENAKSIALEHAGVKSEDVSFVLAEQEYEDGNLIFNVEFITKSNDKYDYEILVDSGVVLAADFEKKTIPAADKNAKGISLEQAQELALKNAGLEANQVTFLKQKTDLDDGRLIYEIEFYTNAYQKYDYDVDSQTGQIIAWDFDNDSVYAKQDASYQNQQGKSQKTSKQQTESSSETNRSISLEDAKASALKHANLKNNQVTWGRVYKEYDDGRLIYKGEFYHNMLEYEFEVDAVSGAIVDWDVESVLD